jgi:dolichol-phosphate mannosyltransferase
LTRWARSTFYKVIDALSEDHLPHQAGDFRLVSRRVVDLLREVDDYHPYLRGLIASFGFDQVGIPYDRASRTRGESKFSFSQLVSLAIDGILVHSVIPLRIASITGMLLSVVMVIGIISYTVGRLFFAQDWPAGFATTTVLLLLSITLNALFLGVIGEYLGRIYQQVKRRPITIIESEFGRDTRTGEATELE